MLTIYCSSASHQLNTQIGDKSEPGSLSCTAADEIQIGQPFVAMDSVKLFCTSGQRGRVFGGLLFDGSTG
jgi:hypothetical protein